MGYNRYQLGGKTVDFIEVLELPLPLTLALTLTYPYR